MSFLRSLPLQLATVILFVILFGTILPVSFIQASYTFSQLFKELLGLILPFMVFFFVIAGILSFKKNAPLVLSIMLGSIFFSNSIAALLSYGVMWFFAPLVGCDIQKLLPLNGQQQIESLFSFHLYVPISAVHALIAAIIGGLVCTFIKIPFMERGVQMAKEWVEKILTLGFIPFLPLYVLGFLLKIRYEGMFVCVIQQYGATFLLIISLQIIYLFFMYFLAEGFSLAKAITAIKNAMPSYLTAFSTMSSTATVPVTIKTAEKNIGNRGLADMAMPIMANVHLLGDSISTPLLAMVTMLLFQGRLPVFGQYVEFVLYFCSSMFAVSGIPGGGILVMIPILVSKLGFTGEMVSIVTTLYFLLDSFGTAANVMGDGALVIMVNKMLRRLKIS